MRQITSSQIPAMPENQGQAMGGRYQAFLLPGLKPPLNKLEHAVMTSAGFDQAAGQMAEFFLRETTMSLQSMLQHLIGYSGPPQWKEKFLLSLLHCDESPLNAAQKTTNLRFLKLLFTRKAASGSSLKPSAIEYLNWLYTHYSVRSVSDLSKYSKILEWLISSLTLGRLLTPSHYKTLINFFDAEAFALQYVSSEILEDFDIDSHNLESDILLPLSLIESDARETRKVLDLIRKRKSLQREGNWHFPIRTGPSYFRHWIRTLKNIKGSEELALCLEWQVKKHVSLTNLVPLVSLCNWKAELDGVEISTIQAVIRALEIYNNGKFAIKINSEIMDTEYVTHCHSLKYEDGILSGDMNKETFFSWIGPNWFPLHLNTQHQDINPDMRDIVRRNLHREAFVERLLNFPRVYQTKGLVEFIAIHSNSQRILSKLATIPYLHSGPVNHKVPAALLRNPAPLPVTLLRPFINSAHFSVNELRQIATECRNKKTEVFEEIQKYLVSFKYA